MQEVSMVMRQNPKKKEPLFDEQTWNLLKHKHITNLTGNTLRERPIYEEKMAACTKVGAPDHCLVESLHHCITGLSVD